MILLNFAHPITAEQQAQIEALAGERVDEIRDIPVHFDLSAPFRPQVDALLAQAAVGEAGWQGAALLVNLPAHNVIAAALLSALHGRSGHFPAVLLLRPVPAALPRYEVAEIVNLQAVRDDARARREGG